MAEEDIPESAKRSPEEDDPDAKPEEGSTAPEAEKPKKKKASKGPKAELTDETAPVASDSAANGDTEAQRDAATEKKKRGRPRKSQPDPSSSDAVSAEDSPKKKRGRPPKPVDPNAPGEEKKKKSKPPKSTITAVPSSDDAAPRVPDAIASDEAKEEAAAPNDVPKKKRGRPSKPAAPSSAGDIPQKKRGRPKKEADTTAPTEINASTNEDTATHNTNAEPASPKKKRGRPPKDRANDVDVPKRPRGRPKKDGAESSSGAPPS